MRIALSEFSERPNHSPRRFLLTGRMMFSPQPAALAPLRVWVEGWLPEETTKVESNPALAEIERLGQRCLAGEIEAWDQLFPRVWPMLVTFVHRLYGSFDEQDAEDVAQAALESAMRSVRTCTGRGLFRGWLFGIAARQASNFHRARTAQKRGAERMVPLSENHYDQRDDRAASPCEASSARDRAAILQRALEELPDEDRELIQLHFFAELTCEEIGQARRLHPKAVASRLHRSRQALLVLLRRLHLTSHDG